MEEVGRVERAHEIETVGGVGRYLDDAVGLRAWLLVAADHVKVHHRAGRGQRTQRMLRHVVRAQEPALFRCKHNEEDRSLRFDGIDREGVLQFDDADRAGAIVVCSVPYIEMVPAALLLDLTPAVVPVPAPAHEIPSAAHRSAPSQQPTYVL